MLHQHEVFIEVVACAPAECHLDRNTLGVVVVDALGRIVHVGAIPRNLVDGVNWNGQQAVRRLVVLLKAHTREQRGKLPLNQVEECRIGVALAPSIVLDPVTFGPVLE